MLNKNNLFFPSFAVCFLINILFCLFYYFFFLQLRSNLVTEEDPLEKIPKEERGSVKDAEINYV